MKNLADPSWWFTGFFVAIIASLLAAYLKDIINLPLSATSKKYTKWRDKRNSKENREIAEISADPTLLLISFGRLIFTLVEFVFCAIAFILFPMSLAQFQLLHALYPISQPANALLSPVWIALILILATSYLAYLLGVRLRKFTKAYKLYLEKKVETVVETNRRDRPR